MQIESRPAFFRTQIDYEVNLSLALIRNVYSLFLRRKGSPPGLSETYDKHHLIGPAGQIRDRKSSSRIDQGVTRARTALSPRGHGETSVGRQFAPDDANRSSD
jgi:hypothetical protein